jgi:hypothetical protein
MLSRFPRPNSRRTSWLPWPIDLIAEWLLAIYRLGRANAAKLDEIATGVDEANAKLDRLLAELEIPPQPSQPGVFAIRVTGQRNVEGRVMLTFAIVNIPAVDTSDPNNSDVQKRTLVVKCGASDTVTLDVPGLDAVDEITDPGFVGNDGDLGAASLTYADGAKPPNVSAPRVVPFQLSDTIAPSMPGEFGVQATGQTP